MNKEYTHIVVVMDKSGSMYSCQKDAKQGLDFFIRQQAQQPGRTTLTLIQFDTEYREIYTNTPIQNVGKVSLWPSGGTALLDAVGRAIMQTGERLKALPTAERPGLVVFVIVTDGEENSSKEYKLPQIKDMIEHQTSKYNWQFTYLGANQDAFKVAGGMGINFGTVSNYDVQKTAGAWSNASALVGSMRKATARGQSLASVGYTDEQRAAVSSQTVTNDKDKTKVVPVT